MDKLARKEEQLRARYELQRGRTRQPKDQSDRSIETEDGEDGMLEVQQGLEQLRLKQQRAKKDRLSYAVERLTLQAAQRERQLRQSLSATGHEAEDADADVD